MSELTKVDTPKEKMSTPNHIQLLELKPEAFGGIRPDMNFLFHLSGGPIIAITGDQGQCKTSLLNCLITLLGGDEPANSENVQPAAKEGEKPKKQKKALLTFKDIRSENVTYEVRLTNSAYTVKKIEITEGTPVTSNIESPKTFMRNFFGPIGQSPMILKEKDGKAQIEWVRSLYKFSPDELKLETEIKTNTKTKFDKRTEVNKDLKRLYKEVADTSYYAWDDTNKCFVPQPQKQEDQKNITDNLKDEETLLSNANAAKEKLDKKNLYTQRLENLAQAKLNSERTIDELRIKLQQEEAKLLETNTTIETGKKYLEEVKDAQTEFDNAQKAMMNVGELKILNTKIKDADEKKVKYDELEAEKILLDKAITELRQLKKEFINSIIPKIEGLELVVNDDIDKDREEGLYYQNHTMQQLSESELWDLYMQICRHLGVRFMFIENAQSLGSDAVERINWFVREGFGSVFYTAMMRGVKELQFTINGEFN